MLASIQQVEHGYLARFERHLQHSVEEVWSWLTENDKLKQWFSELQIDDLREGGSIKFDMQDGTFEVMEIKACTPYSVLEFTWGEDQVRFELTGDAVEQAGCRLVLLEKITKLTSHTPKDIAGWDVCLDAIEALLDGRGIQSRRDIWQVKYEKYVQLIDHIAQT
ncbi:SRPBCC family protein [Paenibacillus sp. 481]|uniref:SRPBCC family protein n=1 Tax=Paenibacillus sp. 481 TaxID=2835869 RepID=UPI001E45D019|nr:SRPBCC family protein [Paenibacillus sp. 481]UHA73622.1 SRPBCC family protein [Paenibacillus sp. 481]